MERSYNSPSGSCRGSLYLSQGYLRLCVVYPFTNHDLTSFQLYSFHLIVNDITRSIGRIFVPSMVISFVLVALASSGVFDQENDRIFAVQIAPHVVFPLIGVAVVATLLNIEEIKVACRKKMYVFLLTVLGTTAFGFFISEVAPMKWYNGGMIVQILFNIYIFSLNNRYIPTV